MCTSRVPNFEKLLPKLENITNQVRLQRRRTCSQWRNSAGETSTKNIFDRFPATGRRGQAVSDSNQFHSAGLQRVAKLEKDHPSIGNLSGFEIF